MAELGRRIVAAVTEYPRETAFLRQRRSVVIQYIQYYLLLFLGVFLLQIYLQRNATRDLQLMASLCGDQRPNEMALSGFKVLLQFFTTSLSIETHFNVTYFARRSPNAGKCFKLSNTCNLSIYFVIFFIFRRNC